MERGTPLPEHTHRHVTSARAFHTDLIAQTHRRLRVLVNLARHLDVLRSRDSTLEEKLNAASSSSKHLELLEQLRRSSNETYRDFRTAVGRIRAHLSRLAAGTLRVRRQEPAARATQPVTGADRTNSDRTSSRKVQVPSRGSGTRSPGA
jgi:hypothetical protein